MSSDEMKREKMREALIEAREVLSLCTTDDWVQPTEWQGTLHALCETYGYGALIQMAVALWGRKAKSIGLEGSNHTAGPCQATVNDTLKLIDDALSTRPVDASVGVDDTVNDLKAVAAHLKSLDSASGEAKLLERAAGQLAYLSARTPVVDDIPDGRALVHDDELQEFLKWKVYHVRTPVDVEGLAARLEEQRHYHYEQEKKCQELTGDTPHCSQSYLEAAKGNAIGEAIDLIRAALKGTN